MLLLLKILAGVIATPVVVGGFAFGWLWSLLAMLALLAFVLAPFTAVPAALTARRTKLASGEDPKHANDKSGPSCMRPAFEFTNTPDDPTGDQGMYEPTVASWLDRFGWRIKTFLWLNRNKWYGLFQDLLPRYEADESIAVSEWWKLKIYSYKGYKEVTWPMRRVSFGYKIHTLIGAKKGDTVWWVFMPAFWKTREY